MKPAVKLALCFTRNGVGVFPCRERDSKYGKAKAPYLRNGMHGATIAEDKVRASWARSPGALIGLPCRANEIVVLDADRHGDGDGVANLHAIFARHGFDPNSVPRISTPRDGLHYVFRHPRGSAPTAGTLTQAVDVRDNAYVIAAGSRLANGGSYSLQNGSIGSLAWAIGNDALPELPVWLARMIAKPKPSPKAIGGQHAVALLSDNNLMRRLAELVGTVAMAEEGKRNITLYWASCRGGELVASGRLPIEAAIALFTEAGLQAALTLDDVRRSVASGMRTGMGECSHDG